MDWLAVVLRVQQGEDVSWVDHTVWNQGYKSLGEVSESCATLVPGPSGKLGRLHITGPCKFLVGLFCLTLPVPSHSASRPGKLCFQSLEIEQKGRKSSRACMEEKVMETELFQSGFQSAQAYLRQ